MKDLKSRKEKEKQLILVVESGIVLCDQVRSVLSEDYQVAYSHSTEDAIAFMHDNAEYLSLVMLDIHAVGPNGLEFIARIKADDMLQHIPVVVLTMEKAHEVEYLQIGAADFIRMPCEFPDVVLARIQRAIESSEKLHKSGERNSDPLAGIRSQKDFFRCAEEYDRLYPDVEMDAVCVDISRFHVVNEMYGRKAGNRILSRMAKELNGIADAEHGIAGRKAADLFLMYLPHRDQYKDMLEQIYTALNEDNREDTIRLKMGVYPNVDKSLDIQSRFDRAKYARDTLHYDSSQIIAYYDGEKYRKTLISQQLMREINTALAQRHFKVYYQPKFDITGSVPEPISAEALVRWHHPAMGVIFPGLFIPLFEDNGLISKLDRYVWEEAVVQMRRWRDKFGFTFPVSVNVSRVDLLNADMADFLINIVRQNGLEPSDLHVEITESAYTENVEQLVEQVNKLHAAGFKIEIDDFGSGYSSLNMLSLISVDTIKLDINFIRDLFGNKKKMQLLQMMMVLKVSLGIPIVAEGVETEEQLNTLKQMGCDIVQGYYFSKPVLPEEFEKFIEQKAAAAD